MVASSHSVLQEQTVEVMEVLAVRSVAVVWRRSLQMEGRPGAVQPKGCRTKGLEAANLEGLETAEVLEATAGLEVEANLEVLEGLEAAVGSNLEGLEAVVETNLEGLEAVVGTNLEVPAVASTWRRRPERPGGGVLKGPAAASWRARRRRPGGLGGGVLEGSAAASWRARRRRPGGPGGGVGSSTSKSKLFSSAS
ncbi:unnamed protein product [Arctogadus glacialis]